MVRLLRRPAAAASALLLAAAVAQAQPVTRDECEAAHPAAWGRAGKDVVWVPTPDAVVHAMLTMAKVTAQSRVPICTGEALQGRQGFRELITRQAADIIQPDTPRAGGLREIKRVAELAETYYISIAPHNMTHGRPCKAGCFDQCPVPWYKKL